MIGERVGLRLVLLAGVDDPLCVPLPENRNPRKNRDSWPVDGVGGTTEGEESGEDPAESRDGEVIADAGADPCAPFIFGVKFDDGLDWVCAPFKLP